MQRKVRSVYDKMHWFSDVDAWKLFRLAAFTEAITWTLLLGSIAARNMGVLGADIAVSMAGAVHGTVLLVYIAFIVVLSRSMEWSAHRILAGLVAGNIPLATLLFERQTRKYRAKNPVKIAAPAGYADD